jgi:predicted DNA-binding WGR domain protein
VIQPRTSTAITGSTCGAWCFVREWGRIGKAGQMRSIPFPDPAQVQAALERQSQAKERRGYKRDGL